MHFDENDKKRARRAEATLQPFFCYWPRMFSTTAQNIMFPFIRQLLTANLQFV
jgi:hypothetical protein